MQKLIRAQVCKFMGAQDAEVAAPDDWELDAVEIKFQDRIASGAFGDLYKGTYCGQDVAIKILRNVQDDSQQYAEFLQVCPPPPPPPSPLTTLKHLQLIYRDQCWYQARCWQLMPIHQQCAAGW